MGNNNSLSVLTEDLLEEYTILTYLSKGEILHLYKVFSRLAPNGILGDLNWRFPCENLEEIFTQLKYNPFKDRIFRVFSSQKDGLMSFEDVLDLCSVMSERCPDKVKAAWAFQIFDFDEDEAVGTEDLMNVIKRLTSSAGFISETDQKHIIKILMNEMDLELSGRVGIQEFVHAVGKMSEFPHSFCFKF
ncbi:calcium and integrin-binding protein 1-like [Cylas formicarius]|uniref:calcium and integrin-binding protein 1-like n=1 Tax=Cylas formicarius TaxID=197179 RepID=UPI002958C8DD|nr:calcium and integrin-binding protein 1-like [Cylas formicarius]